MNIKFYNTLTRTKEEFKPINPGLVSIYSCGPTVYNYAHIGNLRAYIFSDTLRRLLKYAGYNVKQAINLTDVGHLTSDEDEGEDKVEITAKKTLKTPKEITDFYSEAFIEDMERLNIEKPELMPRPTENIEPMLSLIEKLVEKGYGYVTNSGVYFDVSKFPDYPKLARLDMEKMKFGERIELQEDKKNPADFALWVLNRPEHIMQWESPWGRGYPGWHIECSAMAIKYLGETIDIHTGGIDHIPVHHTNEIAQSECATGKKFANFWMHSEFLNITGEKMAKSGENFLTLNTLIEKGYSPLAYRYYLLSNHYRSKIDFSWEKLDQAQKTFENIKQLPWKDLSAKDLELKKEIELALSEDLDVPKVLSLLHNSGNRALWAEFDSVLGLKLGQEDKLPSDVSALVAMREKARQEKNWEESDNIRKEIEDKGYFIKDTSEGPQVIKK